MRAARLAAVLPAVLAAVLLIACAQLPPLPERPASTMLQDTQDTRLGQAVHALAQAHAGESGVLPLLTGHDAFAARLTLAHAAERSLDIQYYIWHDDLTGSMLMEAVRAAARRGVRVRLLLDDNNTAGLDAWLRELDADPQIEVRLFNPFVHRNLRALDYLGDFGRLNRRMHNKSFTADNQVTLVGGRNVGDEYFAANGDLLFVDLDVLAVGTVVTEVSRDFDRYWASASAYPLAGLLPDVPAEATRTAPQRAAATSAYRAEVERAPFLRDLLARRLQFHWGPLHMISDDPAKVLGRASPRDLLWTRLLRLVPTPTREVILVSPYFVPGERGTDFLVKLARSGVQVSVLTNALEATDVPAVHAGYARWRPALLAAGVRLYEMRSGVAPASAGDASITGSSSSSLHAKVFLLDRARVFVGSFNFDPRSVRLNTELGFLVENPALAAQFAQQFEPLVQARTYRVRLVDGQLQWSAREGDRDVLFDSEPHAGWWRRLAVRLLSLLPIDGLL